MIGKEENNDTFAEMHRVQARLTSSAGVGMPLPAKRVIVTNSGEIIFNPNENNYIYFSKSREHHVYFIFYKVLKIIVSELKKRNHTREYKSLGLVRELSEAAFYINVSKDIIKNVQEFFKNYVPSICVEMVTLRYLNTFSGLFETCAAENLKKTNKLAPEISDKRMFGGSYGINGEWLRLLKNCTESTSTATMKIDTFFDFLKDNVTYVNSGRRTLKGYLRANPELFTILNELTYIKLNNPEFVDKNNVNFIRSALQNIRDNRLFNKNIDLSQLDLSEYGRMIKQDIRRERGLLNSNVNIARVSNE